MIARFAALADARQARWSRAARRDPGAAPRRRRARQRQRTRIETLDKVVYEAAACGVPVLASNTALDEFLGGLPVELRFRAARRPRSPTGCSSSLPPGPSGAPGRRGAAPRSSRDHSLESWADAVAATRDRPRRPGVTSGRGDRPVRAARSASSGATSARAAVRPLSGQAPSRLRAPSRIVVLALLDALGLALGLYAALVLRSVVYGDTIFWNLLWREGPVEWLPFLLPITWLVFWQAGLYARRERRAGPRPGRLLARARRRDHARVRLRHRLRLHDVRADPDRVRDVRAADRALRAAYDSFTVELQRLFTRAPRRARGRGREPATLQRVLPARRAAALAYEFVGTFVPRGGEASRCPARARPAARGDPERGRLRRADGARDRRDGAPSGRQGAARAADDRAARAARRVRAGPGVPLFELRPPDPRGADWVVKRAFDLARQALVVLVGLPLWLAIAAAIKLDSRGPIFYRDRRVGRRRAGVRDAQVPDDGRGRRPSSRTSSRSGTRRAARSSRSARIRASPASAACCASSRSTSCRSC